MPEENKNTNHSFEKEGEQSSISLSAPTIPQSENISIIDKADAVAKRMEEANKKAEELLNRQEAIAARMLLSGRAEAGQQKTAEQTAEEKEDEKVKQTLGRYR